MTTYGDMLMHMGGVPVGAPFQSVYGRHWFVDAKTGSDNNSGRKPSRPFLTMDKAFDMIDSGDVIFVRGKIKEQLTTPAGVFDVTIVGAANRPRHADDHSEASSPGRGSSSATWVSPDSATASTPLLKVQQQGWRVVNMLFGAGPASTASILLFRDGGSGDSERDASHFHLLGCRFSAPVIGVQDSGGCAFVRIEDCMIHGATTAAINNVTGAGIGTLLHWQLFGNQVLDCAIGIDLSSDQAVIRGNTIGKHTTYGIDLNGGSYNMVNGNWLQGDYTTDTGQYRAGSNDNWAGNFSMDEDEATVTSGVTHAVPTTD
jgi:hypothetical protein